MRTPSRPMLAQMGPPTLVPPTRSPPPAAEDAVVAVVEAAILPPGKVVAAVLLLPLVQAVGAALLAEGAAVLPVRVVEAARVVRQLRELRLQVLLPQVRLPQARVELVREPAEPLAT